MTPPTTQPDSSEFEKRISDHLSQAKDAEERRNICLTWDGYITALLEWGVINDGDHATLYKLLENDLQQDDPAMAILMGTEGV